MIVFVLKAILYLVGLFTVVGFFMVLWYLLMLLLDRLKP